MITISVYNIGGISKMELWVILGQENYAMNNVFDVSHLAVPFFGARLANSLVRSHIVKLPFV